MNYYTLNNAYYSSSKNMECYETTNQVESTSFFQIPKIIIQTYHDKKKILKKSIQI